MNEIFPCKTRMAVICEHCEQLIYLCEKCGDYVHQDADIVCIDDGLNPNIHVHKNCYEEK